MPLTVERPPAPAPVAPPESSQWAWVAVLAAPFVYIGAGILGASIGAGVLIGITVLDDLAALVVIPILAASIPIIAGFRLGLRSARTGNGSGALAAAAALAEAAFLVVAYISVMVTQFESFRSSLLVGAGAAVATFVVAESALGGVSSRRAVLSSDNHDHSQPPQSGYRTMNSGTERGIRWTLTIAGILALLTLAMAIMIGMAPTVPDEANMGCPVTDPRWSSIVHVAHFGFLTGIAALLMSMAAARHAPTRHMHRAGIHIASLVTIAMLVGVATVAAEAFRSLCGYNLI